MTLQLRELLRTAERYGPAVLSIVREDCREPEVEKRLAG